MTDAEIISQTVATMQNGYFPSREFTPEEESLIWWAAKTAMDIMRRNDAKNAASQ